MQSGESHRKVETMLRSLCVDLGLSAAISPAPLSGKVIKEYAVPNTLSQAWYIGRAIHMARRTKADVIDAIVSYIIRQWIPKSGPFMLTFIRSWM